MPTPHRPANNRPHCFPWRHQSRKLRSVPVPRRLLAQLACAMSALLLTTSSLTAHAAQVAATGAAAPADDAVRTVDGANPSGASGVPFDAACDLPRPGPLPQPGDPAAIDFWRIFRAPLPPAPLWDPPGPKRVGLQAGHWLLDQTPPELGRLQGGSSGGGKQEWEVNLDVAQRVAGVLSTQGVSVDVLPATPPVNYQAHLFLAIHADGDTSGNLRGFKVAAPAFSAIPDIDTRLVDTLNRDYAAATGLPRDDERISRRMTYYYAFNSRRYCHSVAAGVPQAIIEAGFLTSAADRKLLLGDPDTVARGIANSITDFLSTEP
jgi:N-acetylmuramoyl-L-alanine amidase